MKAHSIKTDNANINDKISLRKQATQHLEYLSVLDLFAGNNTLWSNFDCNTYYGIEKEKGKGANLNADNLKIIPSLDLSRFNVIDCDSYGIPFSQIEEIFGNDTLSSGTVVLYTCISNAMSTVNKKCIAHFGFTKMYKKSRVLINKLSEDLFFAMLQEHGVSKVWQYEKNEKFTKKYGYFIV